MPNFKPATKTRAICPKCNVGLTAKVFRELELDFCPSCSGIWLDTLEFKQLSSEKDVYSDPSISINFVPDPPDNTAGYYQCVRCDQFMNRVNFRKISGILVDICGDHGAWLDDNELTRLRSFVAGGGIDKAQDEAMQKNAREITKVAGKLNNLDFMVNVMNRRFVRHMFFGF